MFEKAKEWGATLSAVVLGLSALHVICASIYLYFYCVGFGANISMFFSATDIFSISITKLAGVYVRSLIWPVIIYGAFRALKVKTNDEWIADAPTPQAAQRRLKNMDGALRFATWMIYASLVVVVGRVSWEWWHGREGSAYALLSALSMAALLIFIRQKGYAPIWFGLLAFFISGVVGGALDNGQSDRHAPYTSSRSLPTCDAFKVLARASSLYVGIGVHNTKVLLKEDCEVVFVFPRPAVK